MCGGGVDIPSRPRHRRGEQPGQVGLPGVGAPRPTRPGCSHATVNVVAVSEPSFARAAGHDLIGDLQRAMDDQGVGWAWTQHAAGWLEVIDPVAYGGLSAQVLGTMLGARGVTTRQMNRVDPRDGSRHSWMGFTVDDLAAAKRADGPSAAGDHLRRPIPVPWWLILALALLLLGRLAVYVVQCAWNPFITRSGRRRAPF